MTSAPLRSIAKAFRERASGSKPGVFRALLASFLVGVAAAVLTYRLLRAGD